MTNDEALKVLRIMTEADNGCSNCASGLFREFLQNFPDHKDMAQIAWKEKFEEDY